MNDEHYRTGVGIVLLNRRGEVFLGRRSDIRDAWQMPQGGVDLGEEPAHAALRELKEEIGTDRATIVAEASGWLRYDLPPDLVGKAWGGLWKGQRQKWFVMRFQGEDRDIDIATRHPEFDAWRWAPAHEVADRAAPFKRDVYKLVLSGFESFIAPMRD
ncbi:MAG TPA: RNA pyrophosphohydrolase [Rhodoblastus sp.]|nr:RNA pyrophosphohydrolase [Rhodoblastus sp.]